MYNPTGSSLSDSTLSAVWALQDGAPPSSGEATPMETEQKDAPAAAPQEVEEVIKKKRTRKTNINFTTQTAGMKTEQLTVCFFRSAVDRQAAVTAG